MGVSGSSAGGGGGGGRLEGGSVMFLFEDLFGDCNDWVLTGVWVGVWSPSIPLSLADAHAHAHNPYTHTHTCQSVHRMRDWLTGKGGENPASPKRREFPCVYVCVNVCILWTHFRV